MKVRKIIISFPLAVDLPPGFQYMLDGLLQMVTLAYERDNPMRTMWPSGHGSLPLASDFSEFDDSVYVVEVSEREANDRELSRRKV